MHAGLRMAPDLAIEETRPLFLDAALTHHLRPVHDLIVRIDLGEVRCKEPLTQRGQPGWGCGLRARGALLTLAGLGALARGLGHQPPSWSSSILVGKLSIGTPKSRARAARASMRM